MKRKKSKKWLIIILVIVLGSTSALLLCSNKKNEETSRATVKVERKDIVDEALAVGSIEPVDEIAVKSKVSGVVGKIYIQEGDYTEKGTIVMDVKPDPTPMELAKAKRAVEMAAIEKETLRKEIDRQNQMREKGLISDKEYEALSQQYDEATLRHQISKEELELIEKGKVRIANTSIESVVRAPISGFILDRAVNVGDPVVPLTSYQPGTVLMTMANMDNLIFKGTVDEIDVGKISEGMPCKLQIGALPNVEVKGHVRIISLKAEKQDNSTVFPIEIVIDDSNGATLRAGYSANAHIIIAKKDSVLSLPERVVSFRNDSAFVSIPKGEEESEDVYIETGLSDAITIEVISGLQEGDTVLEKEVKEII